MRVTAYVALAACCLAPAAPAQESGDFLGFRLGEELRYQLGPQESLYDGESAIWKIRLAEVRDEPRRGVFELGFELGSTNLANGGVDNFSWESDARVVVNEHGFPLEVRWQTMTERSGSGMVGSRVRLVYEDGRYAREVSVEGREREDTVHISEHDDLDRDVPIGLYAFSMIDAGCVGGFSVSGRSSCGSLEPSFGNPGLLALALPALWEAGTGEKNFLLLMPTRRSGGGRGRTGVNMGRGSGGGGGSNRSRNRSSGRGRLSGAADGFDHLTLEMDERVDVQIGRRKVPAWRLHATSPIDAVYIDDEGRVLRIDLEPELNNPRNLWIRLLSATEY